MLIHHPCFHIISSWIVIRRIAVGMFKCNMADIRMDSERVKRLKFGAGGVPFNSGRRPFWRRGASVLAAGDVCFGGGGRPF